MRVRTLTALNILLVVALAGSAWFVLPERARAQQVVTDPISHVIEGASKVANFITANNVLSLQIKEYVLDPLVRLVAQMALRDLTASVINFINGHGSGFGTLFVQDLGQLLQRIKDSVSINFFAEIGHNSNSPFAGTLTSALRTSYFQSTSAAGFWSANRCTLDQLSPDIHAFLAGDFSKGGWNAWFGLTTQCQNNPYCLYERLQAELNGRVGAAQANQKTQLGWAQGFLSWCGPKVNTPTSDATAPANSAAVTPNPSCINSDGTPGTTQTPGSVIHDQLSKALGSSVDSLVSAHEIDEMVSAIFSALVTKVLGGTGLFGLSQPSAGGGGSFAEQLRNANGVNTPTANTSSEGSATQGSDIKGQMLSALSSRTADIASYASAWQTIGAAAASAAPSAQSILACEQAHGGGDPYGASAALTNVITPALTGADTASTTASDALDEVDVLTAEIETASTDAELATASNDFQTFLNTPPTQTDISDAETNAAKTGGASAPSSTSLNVSGGTTLDQLDLILKNAPTALAACQIGVPTI